MEKRIRRTSAGLIALLAVVAFAAIMLALPRAALAADGDSRSLAAGGSALEVQAGALSTQSLLNSLNQMKDELDSCRVYVRDLELKRSERNVKTGTLEGDLNKMKGVLDNLNAYADKKKADRAKKAYDAIGNINPPSNREAEAVWQTDAGLSKVTVRWGVPAIAKRDDVAMLHWRVSWRKLGDVKWSSPKTVAYNGSSNSSREYAVTGLEQGTTYEVRVGYRYQVGDAGGSYVTVDDWRSCTATTGMSLTFAPASFDYHFTTHNEGRAALEVSVAGPESFDNYTTRFWYEWYVTPGSAFDTTAANKMYGEGIGRSVYWPVSNRLPTLYGTRKGCYQTMTDFDFGLRSGNAVSTVGVRTVFRSVWFDSKYNVKESTTRSGWSTKRVVADPQFNIGKDVEGSSKKFIVEIPPLKGAQSYTVYLGKRKSANSNKVTGWKVAGTFAARDGKTTKALVSSYGGKKIPKDASTEWAVKVVTNTMYGSSPGEYWVSYNHNGLILHEGMIY